MNTFPAHAPAERDEHRVAKPWYAANAARPEGALLAVANHDFTQLSPPILVACHDREQFEEFTFREGLMCSEIKRLRGSPEDLQDAWLDSKILVLLPEWHQHAPTQTLVHEWVNVLDRYTVELRFPRPLVRKRQMWGPIIVGSLFFWGSLIAWFIRR